MLSVALPQEYSHIFINEEVDYFSVKTGLFNMDFICCDYALTVSLSIMLNSPK